MKKQVDFRTRSRRMPAWSPLLAMLLVLVLAGCQMPMPGASSGGSPADGAPEDGGAGSPGSSASPAPSGMVLTSSAFADGETIPALYTCDDRNVSPPLAWSGLPEKTRSLAILLEDPDAPGKVFVHWLLYGISGDLPTLEEDVGKSFAVEGIGLQGKNDFGEAGYGGPCPPEGAPHHYIFHLYALDAELDLKAQATRAELEQAMQSHILAEARLTGLYARSE